MANPLVATLFPKNRTHYLNILHASWPAGLVIGGVIGWVLGDKLELSWKTQLSLYLVPTALYGLLFLGQHFPKSEASTKGLSVGEMFKDVGILGTPLRGLLSAGVVFPGSTRGSEVQPALLAWVGPLVIIVMLINHTHGSRGESLIPLGAFLLFVLFVAHLLVGAVELGTDGWIQNIHGQHSHVQKKERYFLCHLCVDVYSPILR